MRIAQTLATLFLLFLAAFPALAQAPSAPVELDGHPVLTVGGSPNLTAQERAGILAHRLAELSNSPEVDPWQVLSKEGATHLTVGGRIFLTVTAEDLVVNQAETPAALATRWKLKLEPALAQAREERSWNYLARALGLAGLFSLIAWLVNWAATRIFHRVHDGLAAEDSPLLDVSFGWMRRVPHLSGLDPRPALQTLNLWGIWLTRLALVNAYVIAVLGLFPQTRAFNDVLLKAILTSVAALGKGVLDYVPNMVTIVITLVATRYAIKLIRFLFQRMRTNPEELGFGLPVELLDAIAKLAMAIAWVFAAMVIAPLLPGLGTQTGQLVGLLVGAMITLGSGSTIGNAVAGFVLTYMRPFEVGDRVRVGDKEGDVVERNFTNIRLRTIKNELITITSQQVLGSSITNFTTDLSRREGLILHTTATIGYDVPRHRVEQLFLEAARRTDGIAETPAPFVLVTGLGDFSISYELNAHTFYPHAKAVIYSEMHKNLIDVFDEAGIEILSPTYSALRDGNHTTVASDHVPPDYEAPGFRVHHAPMPPPSAEAVVPAAPHPEGHHRPTTPGAPSITDAVLRRYAAHPHYRDVVPTVATPWEKEEPTA